VVYYWVGGAQHFVSGSLGAQRHKQGSPLPPVRPCSAGLHLFACC